MFSDPSFTIIARKRDNATSTQFQDPVFAEAGDFLETFIRAIGQKLYLKHFSLYFNSENAADNVVEVPQTSRSPSQIASVDVALATLLVVERRFTEGLRTIKGLDKFAAGHPRDTVLQPACPLTLRLREQTEHVIEDLCKEMTIPDTDKELCQVSATKPPIWSLPPREQ